MTSVTPPDGQRSDHEQAVSRLHAERDALRARAAQLTDEMAGLIAASRDSNADDEHDPEGQTIAYERSQLAAMIRRARAHLDEVDAAFARVAAGRYGLCEVCQGPVGQERLEVRPTARTCIEHASLRSRS